MLRAEFLPKPRGDWGAGQPGNVEVLLFPSLYFCPGVEGHSTLLALVLLDVIFHCFSSSVVHTDTVLGQPVLEAHGGGW